jgi:hypothetical protein
MIYTIEKANLVSEQLRKFTDSYAYMVAGQYANIDFWINETISAIQAIDEHNNRFNNMYNAQSNWIDDNNVKVPDYCYICNGICELSHNGYLTPELPRKRAKSEKQDARKILVDSAYYFLIRCYKIGLLNKIAFKRFCDKIGTGIDPFDLK